jgi:hypothetical protein
MIRKGTMSTLTQPRTSAPPVTRLIDTGRLTGLFYLAVGIAGVVGFLLIRPMLFHPDDPTATVASLVDNVGLARVGIGVDLVLVIAQALAALWFFRLFRSVDAFAAGAVAVFGMVNAVAILSSTAMTATALDLALAAPDGRLGDPQLMYLVSENLWGVGNLFFGLWLIPMGWCVLRSAAMPRVLGWVLMAGGVGYVLSGFTGYLMPSAELAINALVIPATVGELWMIGYLLARGDRGTATTR